MPRKQSVLALVGLAAAFVALGPATAAESTLADLAFIAGDWRGEIDGSVIQEVWSEPRGDSMIGMFRLVQDGRAAFYELILIEQTEAGPVMRLKHFSPRLVGWEEKDESLVLPLAESKKGDATFAAADGTSRFVYRLTAADSLLVRLEKPREEPPSTTDFRYGRVR